MCMLDPSSESDLASCPHDWLLPVSQVLISSVEMLDKSQADYAEGKLLVQVVIRKLASCCKERPRWPFLKRKNNTHLGNQFCLTLLPEIQASDSEILTY